MEYVVEWQNCELWEYVHTSQKGKTENWHYLEIDIYCCNYKNKPNTEHW